MSDGPRAYATCWVGGRDEVAALIHCDTQRGRGTGDTVEMSGSVDVCQCPCAAATRRISRGQNVPGPVYYHAQGRGGTRDAEQSVSAADVCGGPGTRSPRGIGRGRDAVKEVCAYAEFGRRTGQCLRPTQAVEFVKGRASPRAYATRWVGGGQHVGGFIFPQVGVICGDTERG